MNTTSQTWVLNEFYGATKISHAEGNKIKFLVLDTIIFYATLKMKTDQITMQSWAISKLWNLLLYHTLTGFRRWSVHYTVAMKQLK